MERTRGLLGALTAVAAVAAAGSLYFSLGLGLNPCDLCWYQRILMYPLVVILGVATLDRDATAWRTGLPLSALGAVAAAYHSYLQAASGGSGACTADGGCAVILWSAAGGTLTIPRLSLLAFAALTVGLIALARSERRG